MEIQRQSEAFAYRLAAPPVSRHYSTKVLQGIHQSPPRGLSPLGDGGIGAQDTISSACVYS